MLNGLLCAIAFLLCFGTGIACNSLLKVKDSFCDIAKQLCSTNPVDAALETLKRDLHLRVEKLEAHWEEMYAKFDRLDRSSKQRLARDRASAEEIPEPVPEPALTREAQRAALRSKMRG